ncbi:22350_t:CDS:2 [Cetraspora pellucida]|uniref:50S ribosomal protein L35 n=1 Tax=Cetraspora pellucida TaxID=1433469 RepID=A0A9N8Z062_9GLOM|nr:22350_t:CDS:2 [Cetraspora pellucida]
MFALKPNSPLQLKRNKRSRIKDLSGRNRIGKSRKDGKIEEMSEKETVLLFRNDYHYRTIICDCYGPGSKSFGPRSLPGIFNGSNEKPNLVHQSLVRPSILPYFEKISSNAFNNSVRLKSVYKYKMKTHSGTKKRWRVTGRGKFKRARAGKAHLNTGVSRARLWTRLMESRWTILYISSALVQMIVAIIIEAIILRINEDGAKALSSLSNKYKETYPTPPPQPQFAYMNYTYSNYGNQYVSIIDGNIWFMVFEAFLTVLCFSASFKWINRINLQIELDFPDLNSTDLAFTKLPMTVLYAEYVQLVILILFVAAAIFLGYKLYGEFGWNIYKKIGADIHTQCTGHILVRLKLPTTIPNFGIYHSYKPTLNS